jgi:hypothetical protein
LRRTEPTFDSAGAIESKELAKARVHRKIGLGQRAKTCYAYAAFVALVTPLDSIEGAASSKLAASFALRLEAVENYK